MTDRLSFFARVCTPAAMVVFLSYELSQSLAVTGWWQVAMLAGSVATAVGIEIVGILAGHTLEGYWRIGDVGRAALSFVLLLLYTCTAVYVLKGNTVLMVVPIVAMVVYLVAALADGLQTAVSQQEESTAVQSAYDLERQRADDEHQRKLEAAKLKLAHEEKLARLQMRAAHRASTVPAQSQPEPAQAGYECEDCNRPFASVQALNAHGRFCTAKVPANGVAH
ncbi:MAG: hypothetical protein HC804_01755 [Anaerolineae bacterium]|nr:hypothetical protein [Anaerolineae bacterium]